MISRRQCLTGALSVFATTALPGLARAQSVKPGEQDVLVVTDVQNCFLPGGTLPVADGDKIVPIINRLAPLFRHVILTQDWHTPGHISFASSHGKKPFETVQLHYG